MTKTKDRIVVNPRIMGGKPVIKGTRIPVYFILELLYNGWTIDEIIAEYPHLTREDILSAIKYAARNLEGGSHCQGLGFSQMRNTPRTTITALRRKRIRCCLSLGD